MPTGLTFREKMFGPFAFGCTDPGDGAAVGRRTSWDLTLHGTVTIDDVAAFVTGPQHLGNLSGEIELPGIGDRIPFRDGVFKLFVPSREPGLTLMVYEAPLRVNGVDHYLAGRKNVRDDFRLDLWPDTTTLEVRLHRGDNATGPVAGSGVIRLSVLELFALLASARTKHAGSPAESALAVAAFGRLFLRNLVDSYLLRPTAYLRTRHGAAEEEVQE
ncbi:hypothetical protein OH799_31955 [Nocardia sp. NBC_00881]|uniref:hypothetical protein n=1 Tax=Nocardia sp. NBC_00881 TaxID=2975995 RepID=UPI003863EC37|nr:hypothetical protein OH799_31955 [Nocardia sp. NBC_00881]